MGRRWWVRDCQSQARPNVLDLHNLLHVGRRLSELPADGHVRGRRQSEQRSRELW